MVFSPHT
jgi:hypothetical protein